jgi:hypothetical protein
MPKQIKDFDEITTLADGDWLLVQPSAGGIYKKITKANLLAGLSSGGGSTTISRNFVSVGDTNGIVYYLGTNSNTTTFSDPTVSKITVTASSVFNNNFFTKAFQRVGSVCHSNDASNQWVMVDFGSKKVSPNHYTIQGRNDYDGHHLRNWQLQGSNDSSTWVTLDTRTNNTSINQSTWFSGDCSSSSSFYEYLRIIQTGANSLGAGYLTLGQIEFYGNLQ